MRPTDARPGDAWGEAMTARLYGELDPERRRRLEDHLTRSPEARRHWEALSETFDALAATPLPDPPDGLESRLMERLAGRPGPRGALATAAPPQPLRPPVGTLTLLQGDVRIATGRRAAPDRAAAWIPALEGDALTEGTLLDVSAKGRALLRLADATELWINGGTLLRIGKRAAGAAVRLVRGEVLAFVARQRRALPILTPDGLVTVLGTIFDTQVRDGGGTRVSVLRGRVAVSAGGARREVGARRRLDVRRGQPPARVRRLRGRDVKRMQAWSGSIAPRSRADERTHLDEQTRSRRMRVILAAAVFAAGALATLFAFHRIRGPEPITAQIQRASTGLTQAATPLAFDTPQRIPWALAAGDAWRQTTLATAEVRTQAVGRADTVEHLELRFVTGTRVAPPAPDGLVRLEHTIIEAEGTAQVVAGPAGDQAQEQGSVIERLRDLRLLETRSAQGQVLDLQIERPSEQTYPDALGPDGTVMLLVQLGAGVPTNPVEAGAEWTHTYASPYGQGMAMTEVNRLSGFEERGGQPAAVIDSEVAGALASPLDMGGRLAGNGLFVRQSLQELHIAGRSTTRISLADGRPLASEGHLDIRCVIHLAGDPPGMRPFRNDLRVTVSADAITTHDHAAPPATGLTAPR